MQAKVWVDIRKGRKIACSDKIVVGKLMELMLRENSETDYQLGLIELRKGSSFNFKCEGYSVTVKPLHNYVDHY